MKKLFLLASLALMTTAIVPTLCKSNEAKAQLVTTLIPIAANDTLTDTDTANVYICTNLTHAKTFNSTNSIADNISRSVTIRVTKVTGTIAGTATVKGSNDGTNWETVGSAYTITNTSGTQVKTIALRSSGDLLFKYYQVEFLSSGSGTASFKPEVLYIRRSN